MKILHCADIHLDSPMNSILPPEKARERRAELIKAFLRMAEFAVEEGISAAIIAGDLFDVSRVSFAARSAVLNTVRLNKDVKWFYLKGNHDKTNFPGYDDAVPENLFMFDECWRSFRLSDRICITGTELNRENRSSIYASLDLDPCDFNIVTLHGQDLPSCGKNDAETIDLRRLGNRGIDYLALGHIHSFRTGRLDGRGSYCYPGCLEARGFDETGKHGFIIIDIDEDSGLYTFELHSMPIRNVFSVDVDVTGEKDSYGMIRAVSAALKFCGCSSEDLVETVLRGELDHGIDAEPGLMEMYFSDRFYSFRLKDASSFKVDYEQYRNNRTLKGEFVRCVEARKELSDEQKARIIRLGIRSLMGEAVEL